MLIIVILPLALLSTALGLLDSQVYKNDQMAGRRAYVFGSFLYFCFYFCLAWYFTPMFSADGFGVVIGTVLIAVVFILAIPIIFPLSLLGGKIKFLPAISQIITLIIFLIGTSIISFVASIVV